MTLRSLMRPAKANELFAKLSETSDGAVKTRERLFAELKADLGGARRHGEERRDILGASLRAAEFVP